MTKKLLLIFVAIAMSDKAFAWEYIGHAEAVQSVQIRPEVSAKLTKINFHEGSFVDKSSALFTLDTSEFQAEVSLRKAEVAVAQAKFDGVSKYYKRLKATKSAVSASDLDNAESEQLQAKAAVEVAKASLRIAEIQLNHTKITAPLEGRIGKVGFHAGSYVSPENVLC
ncbi:MAG: efflux RND transporter periplasmic adaptor subunit [Synergistaceae bacterium]|nr:efflux RND transporter periplasmic adaptor subunit [Synergistaceae bacterium]